MDWCLLICGLMIGSVNAQVDVTPPVLVSLDFAPATVDTTSSSATVTVNARVTDDLSGGGPGCATFLSPSRAKSAQACFQKISGTLTDGIWRATMTIPAFTEPGTWTLTHWALYDSVGNQRPLGASELQAAGFPTRLKVGPPPTVTVTPGLLDFGTLAIGAPAVRNTITITSTGVASVSIYSVQLAGSSDFRITRAPASFALGGSSTTVEVGFSPSSGGPSSADLTINDDATGTPHVVRITGTGAAPAVGLSPATVSFGDQILSTSSGLFGATLTNSGSAILNVTNVTLAGAHPGDFAFNGGGLPISLAPGGSRNISLTFTPQTIGGRSATLLFTSNASGSPHTLPLTGNGVKTVTSTNLTAPTQNVIFGQPVLLTASVSPATAAGSINFVDGSTPLGSVALSGGSAQLSVASLAEGPHSITAVYSGSNLHAASSSAVVAVVIDPATAPTAVTLSSSANPATFGQGITITATVTSTSGIASGLVTFRDAGSVIGTGVLNAAGAASLTVAGFTAGTHPITAVYPGDITHAGSNSGVLSQIVNKADQNIVLTPVGVKTFGNVPFLLSATSSSGLPVMFTVAGNCTVLGNLMTITGAGQCGVTAAQPGDTNYNPALPVSAQVTILKAMATLTLGNLAQVFDGTPKPVAVTSVPAGLTGVSVTYEGALAPPIGPGTFNVIATLTNANYQAAAVSGMLVVSGTTPAGNGSTVTTTVGSTTITNNLGRVTSPGTLTVTPIPPAAAAGTPGAFLITGAGYEAAFQITTTATYNGVVISCFVVNEVTSPAVFGSLRILHRELRGGTFELVDSTILSGPMAPDFAVKTICARTSSL